MGRLIDIDRLCNDLAKRWSIADKKKEDTIRAVMADVVTPIVVSQPTVDAVPVRHGKWVDENGNRPYGYRFNWLCSECGRPQHTSTAKLLKEFEEEHRWCHFCGARMDGEDGDHDRG